MDRETGSLMKQLMIVLIDAAAGIDMDIKHHSREQWIYRIVNWLK